jgi:hypothetical protein
MTKMAVSLILNSAMISSAWIQSRNPLNVKIDYNHYTDEFRIYFLIYGTLNECLRVSLYMGIAGNEDISQDTCSILQMQREL